VAIGAVVQSYKDLRVWREAMDLAEACYRLSIRFPRDEAYGLTAQVRRSAASVPANIAEGYGRESTGSYVQFPKVAQGSLKELETHLMLAERVGIVGAEATTPILDRCDIVGKMLNALIRSLQRHGTKDAE
jgi:four helix bundle protein